MRFISLFSLTLLVGCASNPESTFEQIGLRVASEAPPSCDPGHEYSFSDGSITIRPGETICLNLQVQDNSVVATAAAPAATSENTLIIKFRQEGTNDMVLTLHNPLGTFLRYKAHMLRPGMSDYEYTSSCPVLSKRLGIEHWPHAITELKISDFESLPESETITCQ